MSDCTWLSDRMPMVTLGRAEWTPDEARHLGGCRSCQEEWQLVRAASRIGEGMKLSPEPAALESALLHRLEHQRTRIPPRVWTWGALAGAAAVVAALWTRPADVSPGPTSPAGPIVAGLQFPLAELESLQPAELDSVLQTMDESAGGEEIVEDPGLGDLDSDELQRVLDSWEG